VAGDLSSAASGAIAERLAGADLSAPAVLEGRHDEHASSDVFRRNRSEYLGWPSR
jgi:hypothetical protein